MRKFPLIKIIFVGIGLLMLYLFAASWDVQWDLTSDKRYTLSPLAKEVIRASDEPIVITVLLEGENIPAGYRNFKSYIDYYISELRRYNRQVEVIYKDPLEGSVEEVTSFRKFLSSRGVQPLVRQAASASNVIYPYLSVHNSEEIIFIDLFESKSANESEEEGLLKSQLSFEGKFIRAIQQLVNKRKPTIHILGHRPDLLAEGYNRDPRLSAYNFVPSGATELLENADQVAGVLVVLKSTDLEREELLAIDAIGGKSIPIVWLIDKFDISIDSLRYSGEYLALAKDYTVEDYLFRFGIKLKPELILDLRASFIPQRADNGKSNSEIKMLEFPYHPIIIPNEEQPPVTRLKGPLPLYFVSPIEVSDFPRSMLKNPILTSSPYTKSQKAPALVNFGLMSTLPKQEDYQEGRQIIGVQLEGRTSPYFKNRLMAEDQEILNNYNFDYNLDSQYINQVVISDADFALPVSNPKGGFIPVGYNTSDRQMYDANTQLISNLFESMIFGDDILNLSSKSSTISILNKEKYHKNILLYQFIIICFPLLVLLILFLVYHLIRKRKYVV